MAGSLSGRAALVSGASSGIGEAVASTLAASGARVALSARRVDRLETLAERIAAAGGEAIVLAGDIADERVATRIVAEAVERFGRLDILVNAAGVIQDGGVENADLAQWRRVLDINLLASLYTSRAAIPTMRAQGAGDIINISSTAGRRASGVFGPYATSKFGLNAMSEGMRQEVGGYGIRVCVVEPGATTSELWTGIANPDLRAAVRKLAEKETSMKPEDVAEAILFVVGLPPRTNVSEMLIRPTSDIAPM